MYLNNLRLLNFEIMFKLTFIVLSEERTPEDVRKIIKTAKLHESELTEITQILRFPASSEQNNNFKLMLLDDNLLKEIESGHQLIFKGKLIKHLRRCFQRVG